jgi:hypothetical protein
MWCGWQVSRKHFYANQQQRCGEWKEIFPPTSDDDDDDETLTHRSLKLYEGICFICKRSGASGRAKSFFFSRLSKGWLEEQVLDIELFSSLRKDLRYNAKIHSDSSSSGERREKASKTRSGENFSFPSFRQCEGKFFSRHRGKP